MECNKDEALRAKEIAERKFEAKDLAGAKKFALKAQNLYPPLDGITQMIATLDVHLASTTSSLGEKDWYAVLSVSPSADDDTLKKQYRKLALQLHPDKNKSVGAEGAFKLISEAWSVLSDKNKRTVYDQKRKCFQPVSFPTKKDSPVPFTAGAFDTFAKTAASRARAQTKDNGLPPKSSNSKKTRKQPPSSTSASNKIPKPSSNAPHSRMPSPFTTTKKSDVPPQSSNTANNGTIPLSSNQFPPSFQQSDSKSFWTACDRCKMQYEYLRAYMGRNIRCPNCKQPFVAVEVNVEGSNQNSNSATKNVLDASSLSTKGSSELQHEDNPSLHNNLTFQKDLFLKSAGLAGSNASSDAASQTINPAHQIFEKAKKEHEEQKAAARREEALRKRNQGLKRNSSGPGNLGAGLDNAKRKRGNAEDSWTSYGGIKTENIFGSGKTSHISSRQYHLRMGFATVHVRNVLMRKSKDELCKGLEKLNLAAAAKSAEKENAKKKQKTTASGPEKGKEKMPDNNTVQVKMDEVNSNVSQLSAKKDLSDNQSVASDNKVAEVVGIDVPDPDFHDFDSDRSEKSFHGEEIWATYDDEDGMPRYYALIQKVISYKPFKVRMSFLNSKSNSEFSSLDWVASGFAKTCGEFRIGKYEVKDALNMFSHKVKWEKGPRGVIKIVPREGNIWALYRNWSPDWNQLTPDDVIYKYDMVEVLEDYNEEKGVSVAPLVKVPGFKTVFRRDMDPNEVKRIPRKEMFRFSHQVPSYVLTGEEGNNVPKGCYELDPASTPLELLQVVPETNDDEVVRAPEKLQK